MNPVITKAGLVYRLKKSEGGCSGCVLLPSCNGELRNVFDPGDKVFKEVGTSPHDDKVTIDGQTYVAVLDLRGDCVRDCALSEICIDHDLNLCKALGMKGYKFVRVD